MAILIVDNSADIRLLLQRMLQGAGYERVLTAASAQEAFEILEQGSAGDASDPVELLLMDIVMPDMDGIQACRRLKADDRFRDLPILMVTAQPEVEDLHVALAAGASDYIRK